MKLSRSAALGRNGTIKGTLASAGRRDSVQGTQIKSDPCRAARTGDHSGKLHYRMQRAGTRKGLAASEAVAKETRWSGGTKGNFCPKGSLTSGSKRYRSNWRSEVVPS